MQIIFLLKRSINAKNITYSLIFFIYGSLGRILYLFSWNFVPFIRLSISLYIITKYNCTLYVQYISIFIYQLLKKKNYAILYPFPTHIFISINFLSYLLTFKSSPIENQGYGSAKLALDNSLFYYIVYNFFIFLESYYQKHC